LGAWIVNRTQYISGETNYEIKKAGTGRVSVSLAELERRGDQLLSRVQQEIDKQMYEADGNRYTYKTKIRGDRLTWHLTFYKKIFKGYTEQRVRPGGDYLKTFSYKPFVKRMRGKVLLEDEKGPWVGKNILVRWDRVAKGLRKISWMKREDLIYEQV
jgi:hypothetical protein